MWLLDVDGVINATRPGWSAAPRRGMAYCLGDGYQMRWAPGLVRRIREVAAGGDVTVRWCTTWCAEAEQLERLFGLPPLERAWREPISAGAAPTAKLVAARAVLAGGQRLVWTDDDALPGDSAVREALTAGGRALLIAPRPNRGLQPEHVEAIASFLAAEREGPAAVRTA